MTDPVRVRPIAEGDWDGIVALESAAYTPLGLSEGQAALRSRAEASPGTCFVLDVGTQLAGYLLALPYPAFQYPELARAERPAADSRNLHVHDIVIAPALRRRGMAQRLLHRLGRIAGARGYERISLVAVGDSQRFWSARGFAAHPGIVDPRSYGANAVYMSQRVPALPPLPAEMS
ncbi:GNAT family N-acetyltransferase [Streptomyces sp. NPDC052396]|uniref:GNAT family N-acetyltransferase n=1 Tax=Streptomyces sp. NPDC052396 TaxID=3365689 RepID=UPI0037D90063